MVANEVLGNPSAVGGDILYYNLYNHTCYKKCRTYRPFCNPPIYNATKMSPLSGFTTHSRFWVTGSRNAIGLYLLRSVQGLELWGAGKQHGRHGAVSWLKSDKNIYASFNNFCKSDLSNVIFVSSFFFLTTSAKVSNF